MHLLGGLQLLGLLADVPDADLVVLAAGDHVEVLGGVIYIHRRQIRIIIIRPLMTNSKWPFKGSMHLSQEAALLK